MRFIEFHKQKNAYGEVLCVPIIHVTHSENEVLATIIRDTDVGYSGAKKKLIFRLYTEIKHTDIRNPVDHWLTFPYNTRNKALIGGMIS